MISSDEALYANVSESNNSDRKSLEQENNQIQTGENAIMNSSSSDRGDVKDEDDPFNEIRIQQARSIAKARVSHISNSFSQTSSSSLSFSSSGIKNRPERAKSPDIFRNTKNGAGDGFPSIVPNPLINSSGVPIKARSPSPTNNAENQNFSSSSEEDQISPTNTSNPSPNNSSSSSSNNNNNSNSNSNNSSSLSKLIRSSSMSSTPSAPMTIFSPSFFASSGNTTPNSNPTTTALSSLGDSDSANIVFSTSPTYSSAVGSKAVAPHHYYPNLTIRKGTLYHFANKKWSLRVFALRGKYLFKYNDKVLSKKKKQTEEKS